MKFANEKFIFLYSLKNFNFASNEEMIKSDYIQYWKIGSEKDWSAVETLFEKGNYVQGVFFGHLVLEKLLKAHWVKDNVEDIPPKTHNLIWVAEKTQIKFNTKELSFLNEMTRYQSLSRYSDYSYDLFRILNKTRSEEIFIETNRLKIWLHTLLP